MGMVEVSEILRAVTDVIGGLNEVERDLLRGRIFEVIEGVKKEERNTVAKQLRDNIVAVRGYVRRQSHLGESVDETKISKTLQHGIFH